MIRRLSILLFVFCSIAHTNLIGQSYFTYSGFWHTSNNWSTNSIPTANSDVFIYNVCIVASNASCKNLIIGTIGSVTVDTGRELIVNGKTFLPLGNILVINGKLILRGDIYSFLTKRIEVTGGIECFSRIELP